jgi:hypothetical protein
MTLEKNNLSQEKIEGYKDKPKLIMILSLFLMFNPIVNYLITLNRMGVDFWQHPSEIVNYSQNLSFSTWLLLAVSWSAGFGLLVVRRYSLYFSTSAFLALFSYNLIFQHRLVLFSLLLPAYFLFTQFRIPYLNKRVRWWEQAPRFDGSGHYIKLSTTETYLPIFNISLTGILIDTQGKTKLPKVGESFSIQIGEKTELPCEVVRTKGSLLAMRFLKLSNAQRRSLKTLLAMLTRDGRNQNIPHEQIAA